MRSPNRISFWSLDYVFFDSFDCVFLFLTKAGEEMVASLQRSHSVLEQASLFKISFCHHLICVTFGFGVADWIQGCVHVGINFTTELHSQSIGDLMTSFLPFLPSFFPPSLPLFFPPSLLPFTTELYLNRPSCPVFLVSVDLYCVVSFFLPNPCLYSSPPPSSTFLWDTVFPCGPVWSGTCNPPIPAFQISGL